MLPSRKSVQASLLAFVCAGGMACHRQAVHAAAPVATPPAEETKQPEPPPPSGATSSAASNPDVKETTPESPAAVAPAPKPVEPRPKPVTPAPTPTPEPAPKPAPPTITQRMSPAQEAELKAQTQTSTAEAEANLRRVTGRQLNDVQRDMVDKIRNFLNQAHDASELFDWNRAHILADKARLLSVELVNSL